MRWMLDVVVRYRGARLVVKIVISAGCNCYDVPLSHFALDDPPRKSINTSLASSSSCFTTTWPLAPQQQQQPLLHSTI